MDRSKCCYTYIKEWDIASILMNIMPDRSLPIIIHRIEERGKLGFVLTKNQFEACPCGYA